MKNNPSTSIGAEGLLNALGNSIHNGNILDNLGSVIGQNSIDDHVMKDGGNILGHVFGGQENNTATAICKTSSIDLDSVMYIMKVAAPFVMSYLGKHTKSNNISEQGDIGNLLGNLLGNDAGSNQDIAPKLQDFDHNNFSMDDIAGLLKSGGKGGDIMGTLGKLLG